MADTKGKEVAIDGKKPHCARNYKLPGGVWRFSKSRMYSKRALYKVKKEPVKKVKPKRKPKTIVKPIGGEKNGGKRVVRKKKERRSYPTEDKPKLKKTRKMIPYCKREKPLRKRITPGTVLILLAGRHRGKRVIFLKQLPSGMLLVTGPFKINGCPLRRIHQIYVIATSTRLDISGINIPEHLNDKYFKRQRPKRSRKEEGELFDAKPEEYSVTEDRKKDQVEFDKQIIALIKKHPERKMLSSYLATLFSLRNHMYPHRMKF